MKKEIGHGNDPPGGGARGEGKRVPTGSRAVFVLKVVVSDSPSPYKLTER